MSSFLDFYFSFIAKLIFLLFLANASITQTSSVLRRGQDGCNTPNIPTPNFSQLPREFFACIKQVSQSRNVNDLNSFKRLDEIIPQYGGILNTYNVITEDGYILKIFRIRGSARSPPRHGKPAVLLWHSLGGSSEDFIVQYGDRNLVMQLANAGYDVWLANARSSDFSRHVTLSPQRDLAYWDFSFHEVAIRDFPSVIDLILKETTLQKIFFIGFSQGTVVGLIGLSEIPELNDKIEMGILLGPAAFVERAYNPFALFFTNLGPFIENILFRVFHGHFNLRTPRILPHSFGLTLGQSCSPSWIRCGMCTDPLDIYGFDATQANFTNLPFALSKLANFIELKSIFHHSQNWRSCSFRKYDYGKIRNLEMYGRDTPPPYNLSRVTTPLHIFYGNQDNQATPEGAHRLRDELLETTVQGFHKVNWEYWDHLDFIIGKDADLLVYNKVISLLDSKR